MSTLRHFKIFVSVYRNQSITKAAEELHIAQPSVSLAIKELEKEYDIQLFERMARKIFPTYYGDQFYLHALHIVSTFDEIDGGIREWKKQEKISIGSSITIGTCLLPSLIEEYQKRYPKIQIELLVKNASEVEKALLDNQIDIAFMEGIPHSKNVYAEKFVEDKMVMVMSEKHDLAKKKNIKLEEIARYPILCREKGSASREAVDAIFALHNLHFPIKVESVSNQVLMEGAAHNLGIAFLPQPLVELFPKKKSIVIQKTEMDSYRRDWYMVWHKQKYCSENLKTFMQYVQDNAQEALKRGESE